MEGKGGGIIVIPVLQDSSIQCYLVENSRYRIRVRPPDSNFRPFLPHYISLLGKKRNV